MQSLVEIENFESHVKGAPRKGRPFHVRKEEVVGM
nr:MAG TPA: hypothetical protein [Caudoviricetes sp.]